MPQLSHVLHHILVGSTNFGFKVAMEISDDCMCDDRVERADVTGGGQTNLVLGCEKDWPS